MKPDFTKWIAVTLLTTFLAIWNQWATFFFWLTNWMTISNPTVMYDFSNLYNQGQWWLSWSQVDPVPRPTVYPYAYPPSSLPFLGLFARFNYALAAQLWITLCLAIFAVAFVGLAFTVKGDRRILFVSLAALLFFTSYPLQNELTLGQANLLVGGLTVLSLVSERLRHRFISAALLALGTLIKGPPILFLIYFVAFRRDLRYLVNFAVSMLAMLGVSLFFVPFQLYLYWLTKVFPTLFSGGLLAINESATRSLALVGLSEVIPVAFAIGVGLCVGFALYVNSHPFKRFDRLSLNADAMFMVITLLMLLLGSRSWPQDYVWVLLPGALFLSGLMMEHVKVLYFALVGLAMVLFNLNTYPLFQFYLHHPVNLIPTALFGNLLMISALILFLLRPQIVLNVRRRSERSPRIGSREKLRHIASLRTSKIN